VCWKSYRELRGRKPVAHADPPTKTFGQAMLRIVLADISMSLDNVLAVAGAAQQHLDVLAIGLVVSVALMGLAASLIAGLLERYRWIAWVGLAIVLYVAVHMIWRGGHEVAVVVRSA
jgi:YjbE family integral membrane protein